MCLALSKSNRILDISKNFCGFTTLPITERSFECPDARDSGIEKEFRMKKLIIAGIIAIYFLSISAFAQVRPTGSANNHSNASRETPAPNQDAARTGETANICVPTLTTATVRPMTSGSNFAWGNAPLGNSVERPRIAGATTRSNAPAVNNSSAPTTAPTISTAPTQTYRVGVGDILDIQIPDSLSSRSTLYTVLPGGLLDYPLATGPLPIAGLTVDAIAQRLRSSIKVLDNPEIKVKVRDYSSHSVKVIGFVSNPGDKVLRREAVPVYVVLAEAMPLNDAACVTIVRNGKDVATLNLRDTSASAQLVIDGDVLKVSGEAAATAEFFFAGGEVNAPGQKAFHSGLTLTQAILAAGGTSRNAGTTVRVSRQSADGRLSSTEFNLRNIQTGKSPDPLIQKGDRIEVSRNEVR
jgi:protein involved in polysaccharide export with SLBB domain